jgi:8-oxo-dGTP diphosphatase
MPADPDRAEVRAAGGVVWRPAPGGGVELGVIHRPRYDDWSLPKGKLDRGESWEEAAVREVEEEIGVACELGEELEPIAYRDSKGREKVVRYWLMEAVDVDDFVVNDEVDELRWVGGSEALALLSYDRDKALVAEALEVLGS